MDLRAFFTFKWPKVAIYMIRNGLQKYLVIAPTGMSVFSQEHSTGSITGTVKHQKGAMVDGVNMTVTNAATTSQLTLATNGEGTLVSPTLRLGAYSLAVKATGFKKAVVAHIKIDVGNPSSINVDIEMGPVKETVRSR